MTTRNRNTILANFPENQPRNQAEGVWTSNISLTAAQWVTRAL